MVELFSSLLSFVCVVCASLFWSSLAAVVIQQRWRKYRQRLKNTTSTVKRTEDNEEEVEHVLNNKNTVAATVIQVSFLA